MTEQEAKSRSCPRIRILTFIRTGPGCCGLVGINMDDLQDDFNCTASACAMWVWTDEGYQGYGESTTTARGGGLICIGPERCHDFSPTVGSFAAVQFPFPVSPAISRSF